MALSNINLLILDVDGVLTDGGIIRDDSGQQIKRFHVRDGAGIVLWRRLGKDVASHHREGVGGGDVPGAGAGD